MPYRSKTKDLDVEQTKYDADNADMKCLLAIFHLCYLSHLMLENNDQIHLKMHFGSSHLALLKRL